MGSLIIQFLISSGGEKFIGLFTLITLPFVGFELDTGFSMRSLEFYGMLEFSRTQRSFGEK
jgi:hypothetical protein